MTRRRKECTVCGFPNLRPEGHAEWCERVMALLLRSDGWCARCGKDFTNAAGLGAHRWGSTCVPTSASSTDSLGSATAVESVEHGAVGAVRGSAAPAVPHTRSEAHTGASLTNNAAR